VLEKGGDLPIRVADRSGSIDDEHRIGRGFECAARELWRSGAHGGRLVSLDPMVRAWANEVRLAALRGCRNALQEPSASRRPGRFVRKCRDPESLLLARQATPSTLARLFRLFRHRGLG